MGGSAATALCPLLAGFCGPLCFLDLRVSVCLSGYLSRKPPGESGRHSRPPPPPAGGRDKRSQVCGRRLISDLKTTGLLVGLHVQVASRR